MQEIITVNGQEYRLEFPTPLTQTQRNEVIKQLGGNPQTSLCKSCGDKMLSLNPATGCGITKNKGQTATLTGTSSGGTGTLHYDWIITKPDGSVITPHPTTTPYTLQLSNNGIYKIRLRVYDECPNGAKECYDPVSGTCDITVIDCTVPTCGIKVE